MKGKPFCKSCYPRKTYGSSIIVSIELVKFSYAVSEYVFTIQNENVLFLTIYIL